MNIRFITKNKYKIKEITSLLENTGVSIIAAEYSIDEIQTENVEALIRDKLLKAFNLVGRPVFVEHTGLYIESLNGFPGGLTQIFWDKLQADNFSKLLGVGENTKLIAKTIIGYCDSMKIHIFEGEVYGKISPVPKGPRDFQWDCIFIPDGENKTFAEMGGMKNEISMRKKAFDKFKHYLLGE
ncbi:MULTISPECIES: non-canonical purine NTP pyrophosphatase [Serratia]|uniref:non-canonical purine NTP pyrophosphatase n=1 Tax=Serratia TaxID=613 RepID=UPI001F39BA12|nr:MULTISPECIES: non-canonical purine NTP pyrophosphatase [Serratia]MCE9940699.1 non-canonical purine NTP pyrophosphatase [Serratia liquefaciens]